MKFSLLSEISIHASVRGSVNKQLLFSGYKYMANPETTDPCADPELFFGRGGVRAILCFPEGPISGKFKM